MAERAQTAGRGQHEILHTPPGPTQEMNGPA